MITIITPVFNGAATIGGCLQSIDRQTLKNVGHIVIDAASTDDTLAVVATFPAGYRRVLSELDKGIYDGMNKGPLLALTSEIQRVTTDEMMIKLSTACDVKIIFSGNGLNGAVVIQPGSGGC